MSVQLRDDQNRPSAGGVESLPEGWLIKPLGEVLTRIIGGGTPSRENPDYWEGNIPWLTVKDMRTTRPADAIDHISQKAVAESSTNIIPADTVIIATRVGLGKVIRVPYAAAINQDLKALIVRSTIEKSFLEYWFLSIASYLESIGSGTTVKGIRLEQLKAIEMPVPSPEEQRRIVAEIEKQFTRLEAGVAALRRAQANLKRYRAAVLNAACEGRLVFPEAEPAKAGDQKAKVESGEVLLARILTERRKNWQGRGKYKEPDSPETANLPELPRGWTWAAPAQLSSADAYALAIGPFGSNLKVSDYTDAGVPLVFVRNIRSSRFGSERTVFVSAIKAAELRAHQVRAGDILVTKMGDPPGDACLYPDSELDAIITADCIKLRLSPLLPDKRFFVHAINSQAVKPQMQLITKGVAQLKVSLGRFSTLAIPLPPLSEQTRIVAEVERRLSVVEELESVVSANLQRATRLRQSILQKAFTGELVEQSVVLPTNVIEFPKAERNQGPNTHFARALLSAEIVHRLHRELTFGRIKHQKIFHLCEHIAQIEEIQGQYHREAAGPLDNKLIYANEAELKKQKWYQEVHRDSFGHAYKPLVNAGNHRKYVEGYWPDKLPVIEKLIELMRDWNTNRCEIFCTTYAAWNDLIILGEEPTEAAILREILERWHDSKKRFPEERWRKAIGWMRTEGFVPTGFGKPTKAIERT